MHCTMHCTMHYALTSLRYIADESNIGAAVMFYLITKWHTVLLYMTHSGAIGDIR